MTQAAMDVPLASVTTWLSGGTPDRATKSYWYGSTPWISAATLKRSRIHDSEQHLTEAGVRAGSRLAPKGAILVLVRGMALHREVRVGMTTRPVSFNQDVKALIPRRGLISEFLLYSLQARSSQILALVSSAGSGTGVLNTQQLQRVTIWLPDQETQRRIVAAIEAADRYIEVLERLIAKKQAMRQGMVQQLLTGRTRLHGFSDPWVAATLGTLGTFLRGRGIKRDDVRGTGVRCIRYGELYTAFDDYASEVQSFVSPAVAATALPLRTDDLLFAGSGETREEIGKCVAYVGSTPAVVGGDVIVLRGDGFNPILLALLANTPEVISQKARAGQGDTVVHIYSHSLAAIEVNLPPRAEQDVIARVVTDADREIEVLRGRLTKAHAVKQGMMQELLTGRTRFPVENMAA